MRNAFPVLHRRFPHNFFKCFGKIVHIGYPAVLGDRLHLQRSGIEQQNRMFYPLLVNIICERAAGFLFEKGGKIAGIHFQKDGLRFQAEICGQIKVNIGDDFLDRQRISFQRMVFYQQAVFIYHFTGDSGNVALVAEQFDFLRKITGKVVDVYRMDRTLFRGLSH